MLSLSGLPLTLRPSGSHRSLTLANPLQKSLLTLSAHGISVFSPHTSLDVVPGGMNDFLASAFNVSPRARLPPRLSKLQILITGSTALPQPLEKCDPVTPSSNPPAGFEGSGEGKIITLAEGLPLDECVKRVKTLLGLKFRACFFRSAPLRVCARRDEG